MKNVNNKKCKYTARFHDWIHLYTATITCLENYADRYGIDSDRSLPYTYKNIKIVDLKREDKSWYSPIAIANINEWTNNLNCKNWGMHILRFLLKGEKTYWDDSIYEFAV